MKRKRQTGGDRSLSKIKYLPCKQTQELSPGTEADHGDNCTCNRGVEEAKAGGSLGLPSQPAPSSQTSGPSEKPCLKR